MLDRNDLDVIRGIVKESENTMVGKMEGMIEDSEERVLGKVEEMITESENVVLGELDRVQEKTNEKMRNTVR